MHIPHALSYSLSGFLVGLLVGQTGVGGGSLMTPVLMLLFGMAPSTAVGTDLLYASATKAVGSVVHGANHNVNWRLTGLLAAGSLPATAITLFVMSRYNLFDANAGRILSVALGVVLVATGGCLFLRRQLLAWLGPALDSVSPRRTTQLTILTGAVLGVCISLTSVGAGAIGVTAMLALYPRLPVRTVVGSDIAHAVPLTLLAGFGHFLMGSVDLGLLLLLLMGSVPGVLLGSMLMSLVPDTVTRFLLATVLLIVGGRLVF